MVVPPVVKPVVPSATVAEIIDKFLTWCREHHRPETYEWYCLQLQLFIDSLKKQQRAYLAVTDLRPFHLDDFLSHWTTWSSGMKYGACQAIQRAMRWAEQKGSIDRSPTAHCVKPCPGKRNVVISPA
jgi:hypothetical protein